MNTIEIGDVLEVEDFKVHKSSLEIVVLSDAGQAGLSRTVITLAFFSKPDPSQRERFAEQLRAAAATITKG